MKRYTKYSIFLITLVSLLVFSCEKFLDQAPAGEQTKEYIFTDYLRTQRYIDVIYSGLTPTWLDGGRIGDGRGGYLESATDMAEYTATYGVANVSFNIGNWLATAASSVEVDRWSYCYTRLRRCYMFLENMNSFTNDPVNYYGTVRRKALMKGEVQFMIAYFYNELNKRYGGVPLIKSVMALDNSFKIPRATYDETKEYILHNLDSAMAILPHVWPTNDHGRVTKTAAMALKTRVLLYAASPLNNPTNDIERWREAANAARDLIDTCEITGRHSLYPAYQNLFMRNFPEDVKEIIMPAKRSSYDFTFNSEPSSNGSPIRNNAATPGLPFQGFGSNSPTQNFVDMFEVIKFDGGGNAIGTVKFSWDSASHVANIYKNRDPRFYYTVLYNDAYWISRKIETWYDGATYGKDINPKDHLYTRTGYYLKKYWPKECLNYTTPGGARMAAFHFRYGEVLLSYAEAMNEVFGPDVDGLGRSTPALTARGAVNRIRARLVCPPFTVAPATTDPYYSVYQERLANPNFPVLPTGMPPIVAGLSTDNFRERVQNERTIELCFEDQYWYDILRWKQGDKHIGTRIYGVDVVKTGATFTYTRKIVEDRVFDPNRMYRYPIPQKEVQVMGITQNPGW